MSILKKKNKTSNQMKPATKFLNYGGFNEQLGMILSNGKYIRVYELMNLSYGDPVLFLLPDKEVQLLFHNKAFYIVMAEEGAIPEDVLPKFKDAEDRFGGRLRQLSVLEWFNLVSEMVGGKEVAGLPIPDRRQKKKNYVINDIAPYNYKPEQKDIKLSGKEIRTLLFTNYPSRIYPSFISELMRLSDNITVSVFLRKYDKNVLRMGMKYSGDTLKPSRKTVMNQLLDDSDKMHFNLFNTTAYISVKDDPEVIGETMERVRMYCKKYLMNLSDLDYQQYRAFMSVLPLMRNGIHYDRTLTDRDVLALLPVSELEAAQSAKSAVPYGEDILIGPIEYSRLVGRENGFILSTKKDWAVEQAYKELDTFRNFSNDIVILQDKNEGKPRLTGGLDGTEVVKKFADLPDSLKEYLFYRFVVQVESMDGVPTVVRMNSLKRARKKVHDTFSVKAFTEAIDNKEAKEILEKHLSEFPAEYHYREYQVGSIKTIVTDGETDFDRIIAYTAVIATMKPDMLYSMNTEMLVNRGEDIPMQDGVLYTLLIGHSTTPGFLSESPTGNIDHVYIDDAMKGLIASYPFLLIGEHRTAEKIMLNAANPMTKDAKDWISEPSDGVLFESKEVDYFLK